MTRIPVTGRLLAAAVVSLALGPLSGCATLEPVQPWEKRALAKPSMRFDGDRLETHYARQLYSSKESANGGDSVGAGSCGCN